ncbi:UNVERIFIED_CONTAM: hypothetical protein Cloal_1849 [Acetivibrio alkalicellulosi]
MKIIVFRSSQKKNKCFDTKKSSSYVFEKFLYFSFIFLFFSLIITQSIMYNNNIRAVLVNENNLEGRPLGLEEYLYNHGEILLRLNSENTNEKVKILINGDEIASFFDNPIKLKVKDGDVIEIDCTMAGRVQVEIIPLTKNIVDTSFNKTLYLESEIKQLTKIRFD